MDSSSPAFPLSLGVTHRHAIKKAIELCLEVQEGDFEQLDFVGVQRVTGVKVPKNSSVTSKSPDIGT
jgi:hypothetical protein